VAGWLMGVVLAERFDGAGSGLATATTTDEKTEPCAVTPELPLG